MLFGLSQKAWIAIGAVVLVGGGAAITGAVVAQEDDFEPVAAPDWKAGYNFAYQVTGDADYLVDVASEDLAESQNITFGPFEISKEILATDYEHNGQPVYVGAATLPIGNIVSGSFFGEDFGDVQAFATADRQYDLSPIPVMPDWDCQSNDCPSGGLVFGADNPFTYLSFPLTPDKRWEQQADLPVGDLFADQELTELEGIEEVHMVGEVTGKETITLPQGLGETEAIRVDFSYTPVGLQKKIADVRDQMEEYGITVERLTVQLGLHEIAHYSPEYQAIVRDEWVVRALVDVAVTAEYQGETYTEEGYFEASVHAVAELIGAQLVEKPEMEPLQILGKLSGRDPIQDAKGQARVVRAEDYSISLAASETEVNAAEGEKVAFNALLSGVDALPDGHSVSFQVLDATGLDVTDEDLRHDYVGEGGDFVYAFSEPGVYSVYAQALDADGQLVAQDAIGIVANYKAFEDADCGAFGSIFSYSCEPAAVPVRAGIQSLHVDADAQDMDPFFEGYLVLEDSEGNRYQSDYGDDSIVIDDFSDKPVGEDWEVYWQDSIGVMNEVEYGIFLDYGALAPEPAPESGDGGEGGSGGGLEASSLGSLFEMLGPLDSTLRAAKDGNLADLDADSIGVRGLLG